MYKKRTKRCILFLFHLKKFISYLGYITLVEQIQDTLNFILHFYFLVLQFYFQIISYVSCSCNGWVFCFFFHLWELMSQINILFSSYVRLLSTIYRVLYGKIAKVSVSSFIAKFEKLQLCKCVPCLVLILCYVCLKYERFTIILQTNCLSESIIRAHKFSAALLPIINKPT